MWSGSVSPGHSALDFHGTAHCVDRARKFDQGTITRGLHDAAAMLGNLRIDEFAPICLERCESAFLVNTHQAAVAGDIGSEDGGQPPFDTRLRHRNRSTHDLRRAYG